MRTNARRGIGSTDSNHPKIHAMNLAENDKATAEMKQVCVKFATVECVLLRYNTAIPFSVETFSSAGVIVVTE